VEVHSTQIHHPHYQLNDFPIFLRVSVKLHRRFDIYYGLDQKQNLMYFLKIKENLKPKKVITNYKN